MTNAMFTFASERPRRRLSLTPMIDVVFLLLVFFMLAARFGQDFSVPLSTSGVGAEYTGPPRLITLSGENLLLNGAPMPLDAVIARLPGLMNSPDNVIFLQPGEQTNLQQMVDVLDTLRAAGFTAISLVGAP